MFHFTINPLAQQSSTTRTTTNTQNNTNTARNDDNCCANAGKMMNRIDAQCMQQIEDKFTQYYRTVIESDERKTFHHELPSIASSSSSSIIMSNNSASSSVIVVVKQFVHQCVRILRRIIVPLLSCSTPIVIYVLCSSYYSSSSSSSASSNNTIRNRLYNLIRQKIHYYMQQRRQSMKQQHDFNLIEMLIAISILVTFSSLTSSLYHQKLFSSRVQFTKIQLHLANQALMLLHAETGVHPLQAPLLDNVEVKDAWGNDFIYVPYVNLDEKSQSNSAALEVVADLIAIYGHAPEILYLASKGEFFFAEGPKGVIFGEEVSDQNKRYILSVVKKMREGHKIKALVQGSST